MPFDKINVNDLYNKANQKETNKFKIYDMILEKCYTRIKRYSENNKLRCLFEIPTFMLGVPLYDFIKLKSYIIQELKKNYFKVIIINDNIIYISWNLKNKYKPNKTNNNNHNFKNINDFTPITEIYSNKLAISNIDKKINIINL